MRAFGSCYDASLRLALCKDVHNAPADMKLESGQKVPTMKLATYT